MDLISSLDLDIVSFMGTQLCDKILYADMPLSSFVTFLSEIFMGRQSSGTITCCKGAVQNVLLGKCQDSEGTEELVRCMLKFRGSESLIKWYTEAIFPGRCYNLSGMKTVYTLRFILSVEQLSRYVFLLVFLTLNC